ncbi:MAG TPA: NTPase [Thermodesulfobacteriota bacterium]|nr:NTPase [Thermodesulfobacteriota bacterium]
MSLEKNLLITGLPGVGKTTLIRKLHEALRDFHPVGFYTAEIRQEGMRKGFELVDLKGKRAILSHIGFKGLDRVGRYEVDVGGFEDFLGGISFFDPSSAVIMIDEIGKMECLSSKFKRILEEVLDSEKWVIATVALKGSGLITGVKQRRDVKLFEMTKNNRGILLSEILKEIDPKETHQD